MIQQHSVPFGVDVIKQIIPHRYPLLLVDWVSVLEPGYAKGAKSVSGNEPVFQGHFPDFAVLPGIYVIEALAQLVAIHQLAICEDYRNKICMLAGCEHVRFKQPIYPGSTLTLEAWQIWKRGRLGKSKVQASIGEDVVVTGEISFASVEPKEIS